MGAAAYRRGSKAISAQIDRELESKRMRQGRYETCRGRMFNTPGKRWVRCDTCRQLDYEQNEGDKCTRDILVTS